MKQRTLFTLMFAGAVLVLAPGCGREPLAPDANTPVPRLSPGTADRMLIGTDGSTWTEWDSSLQPMDQFPWNAGWSTGCPPVLPPPGSILPAQTEAIWYTVTYLNGSPIQRKMLFLGNLTFAEEGPSLARWVGYHICGYHYTRAVSTDGDWEMTGGIAWFRVLKAGSGGISYPIRVDNATVRRVPPPPPPPPLGGACDNLSPQIILDEDSIDQDSGGCDGGGEIDINVEPDGTCESDPAVVEASYDGGYTWTPIAWIWVVICD